MSAFSIDYEFEELRLCGDGLMAWGVAELVHDGDGEFYVNKISINGRSIDRTGSGPAGFPSAFNKALFAAIAGQIEASGDAQKSFAQAFNSQDASDPDAAHDGRRAYEVAA